MNLHTIKKSSGRTSKKMRVGRGNGSGKGNYSTKGLKGQKARSGFSQKAFFEGGQTPLSMRLPKRRGFKRYFKLLKDVRPINIGKLQNDESIADGSTIDKSILVSLHYIHKEADVVKILGTGDISKKLTFKGIEYFSTSAREKITTAGGVIAE